jgi:hypothetical protein
MNNNNHHHPPPPRGGEIYVFLGILSEAFILSTKKQTNKQNVMMMKVHMHRHLLPTDI